MHPSALSCAASSEQLLQIARRQMAVGADVMGGAITMPGNAGWFICFDSEGVGTGGRLFYYHQESATVQYERPAPTSQDTPHARALARARSSCDAA